MPRFDPGCTIVATSGHSVDFVIKLLVEIVRASAVRLVDDDKNAFFKFVLR